MDFLSGGGELGALMRARDWAATPLGKTEEQLKAENAARSRFANLFQIGRAHV